MKTFFILFLFTLKSFALSVYPLTNDFDIGQNLSKTYDVRNDSKDRMVALEISIENRTHKNGKEENTESLKDFKIFPQSLLLKPNQSKSVRITYIGSKDLDKTKAYRIIFTEKPVKDQNYSKDFKTLMQFRTSAFVSPKNSKSSIKLIQSKIEKDKIYLKFKNDANRYQSFQDISLNLIDGKNKEKITAREEKSLMFILLPEEVREVVFPNTKGFKSTTKVEIDF